MEKYEPTLIESLLGTSVYFNDLLIPLRDLDTTLARYAHVLTAANDCEVYSVSLVASCVALKYRERYFVVCTKHQLKGWDHENIGLIAQKGETCITSGGTSYFENVNEIDFHDLAAFNFTDPCTEKPELKNKFFNLKYFPPETTNTQIKCLVVSGYPSSEQNYDLANNRKLELVKRIVLCSPDGPKQPSDPSLMRLKPINPLCFDPNGMSGGSAFVIQEVEGVLRAYFAGIVVRANQNYIHIVKNRFVKIFLDEWIARINR